MKPVSTADLIERLCAASIEKAVDPRSELAWPDSIDDNAWYFSPELISLFGTDAWDRLDERARKRLSFFEAVNFFSLNVHGEKALIEGLAQRLYAEGEEHTTRYLHHFLDEENRHMEYFGGFCRRYAGKLYRDRKLAFPRDYAEGEEDFLFYVRVLIFEELVDVLNQRMARDERLAPIARSIQRLHHLDESRHLVFGREKVEALFERFAARWPAETLTGVREYVASYFAATWREYANPDVYADVGLDDPFGLAQLVRTHATCRERRREIQSGCVRFLLEREILREEPQT
jgi:hypothetical protein